MNITPTTIPDVLVIEPKIFRDERGFFFESFNQRSFAEKIGKACSFLQDNHSRSIKHVLHRLHYQIRQPQGKLVRVIAGEIFDVAVDIRGLRARESHTEVLYKTTDYWSPQDERCIIWNDTMIGITWPSDGLPVISSRVGQRLLLSAKSSLARH